MDIILTGIARSGTTLACSLVNSLPQCVALHEPMNPAELVGIAFPDAYMARIASFFAAQRASLLCSGTAVSKAREGRVPDNPYGPTPSPDGLRPSTVQSQDVHFGKQLRPDFRLVIKHPNVFTATLASLQTRYPCYAIVRNPLAVLLSWHSIKAPVNDGRVPFGEVFDPGLRSDLAAEPDRLGRQLIILRWCYSRYVTLLPRHNVIRYEDLVASGGRALAVIDPEAATLAEPLESRNTNTLYDAELVCRLADRLLEDDSIYGDFYDRSDVDSLSAMWTQRR